MFYYENQAQKKGFRLIIGVDEAGRGPLAGPVVAAAISLKRKRFQHKIADSKTIAPRQREEAFHEILQKAYVGVGVISETVIDSQNILKATHHAMTVAITRLVEQLPQIHGRHENFSDRVYLLIDGNSFQTDLPFSYRTIIRGDALCPSIACASIVAKVIRDRILRIYDKVFPQYGFGKHKGYPTLAHRQAIFQNGPSPIHRKSFHWNL